MTAIAKAANATKNAIPRTLVGVLLGGMLAVSAMHVHVERSNHAVNEVSQIALSLTKNVKALQNQGAADCGRIRLYTDEQLAKMERTIAELRPF